MSTMKGSRSAQSRAGPTALHPDLMTPAERLDEIAEILAAGILRVRAKQRALQSDTGEQVRVDFSPDRSGHARPSGRRRRRHAQR